MPAPTGPTNPILRSQIQELRTRGNKEGVPFMIKLADELSKSERSRRCVNVSCIERFAEKGDTVVVPCKLLSNGIITKAVTVAVLSTSAAARSKIESAGGKIIDMTELLKKHPKGSGVKIIG